MRSSVTGFFFVLAGIAISRLFDFTPTAHAEAGSPDGAASSAIMHVINSPKTNDTLAFVYDTKTQRLLLYSVGGEKNKELSLCSVRNTAYDVRVHELNNYNAPGTSVKELKKAFDEEDKKSKPAPAPAQKDKEGKVEGNG